MSHHYDTDEVRRIAVGRWPDILSRLGGVSTEILDGGHHPCPLCGGTDRFRLIDASAGALLCNQCGRNNGDGFASLSWLTKKRFPFVLKDVAEYLGVRPSSNGKDGHSHQGNKGAADPSANLKFGEWSDILADLWCRTKPVISPAAVQAIGGQLATYRGAHSVVAIPVYGEKLIAADPCGWHLYHAGGRDLPIYGKTPGAPPTYKSKKLTAGSQPGWIGHVGQLAAASAVWITEGPSDLLALVTAGLPDGQIALSGAHGAGEKFERWMLESLRGKTIYICHDRDVPGEEGAAAKAKAVAEYAAEVRIVNLPYPRTPDHGHDLREFLGKDGKTVAELLEIAAAAEPVAKPQAGASPTVIEEDDDPHLLARLFAATNQVRFWRQQWFEWDGRSYKLLPDKELSARVNLFAKREFDRIWQENTERSKARKVGRGMVSNIIAALESQRLVPSSTELGTWLGQSPGKKHWIAMRNGICQIDRFLANEDDILLPHSPDWFSLSALPYDFDPKSLNNRKHHESFLNHNQEGDAERIAVLQEFMGYCFLPGSRFQKFLFLEGDGSNGKSVYCAMIRALVGPENVSAVALKNFGERFQLTGTIGKLINIDADCEEVERASESDLKSFTSGDAMHFDRKGLDAITAVPTAKLILAANNRPRFGDRSQGLWRRMIPIPFRVKVEEHEKILGMDTAEWWEASGELPGIFLWAIIGLARLLKNGRFTNSKLIAEALSEYQQETNPAKSFLQDHYCESSECRIPTTEVYSEYKKWCDASGYRPFGDRIFGKEVKRIFKSVERKQIRTEGKLVWHYVGMAISGSDF